MVGAIQVEPGSLTADALDLAGAQVPIVPPMAVPPAADPVSQGVAAVFEAHSGALTTVVEHSGVLRAHGGAVVAHTAASLQGADADNGATFAALAGGTGPAAAPSVAALPAPAAPPQVALPEIPAVPPPPMLPGDALSKLIHGGAGASGLREFADAWRAHADTLDELADQVVGRGAAIDEHWVDGHQRAGANTREHGYWLRDSADQARTIAAGAAQVAGQFDTAKTATPSPEEFDDARREFMAAQARRDPTGMAMAARQYAQMQAQAVDAAMAYHGGATSAANTLGAPLQTAPAIARGGSAIQAADYTQKPEQPPPQPGQPGAGGNTPSPPNPARSWQDVKKYLDSLPDGENPRVKTLPNPDAIRNAFNSMTQGMPDDTPPSYNGTQRLLPDGSRIGLRESSSRNGGTTMDLFAPDKEYWKIHLPRGAPLEGSDQVTTPAPTWGTHLTPDQARQSDGEIGILQRFIDAFGPPDPRNTA